MMKFLRSQSQFVLTLILIMIGASFLLYSNAGLNLLSGINGPKAPYGSIDGHDVEGSEFQDTQRKVLNSYRFTALLTGKDEFLNDPRLSKIIPQRAWEHLLLNREADKLNIRITDQQVIDYVRNLPQFKDDKGVFQQSKLETFVKVMSIKADMNLEQFEETIRDQLRVEATVKALVGGVHVANSDIQESFQKYYGPTSLAVVTFDVKPFADAVKVTPGEIEAEYKAHPQKTTYRTMEKRKVDYVLFMLSPDQIKLPEADKKKALAELSRKADDFGISMQPDPTDKATKGVALDFAATAQKMKLEAKTTDFFTPVTTPAGLPPSPSFNNAAFQLTKDNPLTKAEMENGYAMIHLQEIQPSELRPLSEVAATIESDLKNEKGHSQMEATAKALANQIKEDVAKGISFQVSADKHQLKVENVPPFVLADVMENSDSHLKELADISFSLTVGQVSAAIPSQTNPDQMLICYVVKRDPADSSKLTNFAANFRDNQEQQLMNNALSDWLVWRGKQPGVSVPVEVREEQAE